MAAGTPFTGKDGDLKKGSPAAQVVQTVGWEVTIGGVSGKYASNSTSGWRKTVLGASEWSGNCTVLLHAGEAQPFKRGDEVAAQFHVDSDDYIGGTILITEVGPITVDLDSGEPIAIQYSFDGQGAPTDSGTAFAIV
jgi:hypothetical protein